MRTLLDQRLEQGRIRGGEYASMTGELHGAFRITAPTGGKLLIVSSGSGPDADGWEHVSVSLEHRVPLWREMNYVKDLFWREDEWVVQYHPAKADYVNCHPNCLHLWRCIKAEMPTPPSGLVGPKPETGDRL